MSAEKEGTVATSGISAHRIRGRSNQASSASLSLGENVTLQEGRRPHPIADRRARGLSSP